MSHYGNGRLSSTAPASNASYLTMFSDSLVNNSASSASSLMMMSSNGKDTAPLAYILASSINNKSHYAVPNLPIAFILAQLNTTDIFFDYDDGDVIIFPDGSITHGNWTYLAENTYASIMKSHLIKKADYMRYNSEDYIGIISYATLFIVGTVLNTLVLAGLFARRRRGGRGLSPTGSLRKGNNIMKRDEISLTLLQSQPQQQAGAHARASATLSTTSAAPASVPTALDFHIFNLCIADLCVSVVHCGTEGVWRYYVEWPDMVGGEWMCKFMAFIRPIGLFTVSFITTCIALDRLIAVTKPLSCLTSAHKRARYMIATCWVLGILCSVPQAVYFRLQVHPLIDPEFRQCQFSAGPDVDHASESLSRLPLKDAYAWMNLTTLYYIPFAIIIVCYGIIFVHLRSAGERRGRYLTSQPPSAPTSPVVTHHETVDAESASPITYQQQQFIYKWRAAVRVQWQRQTRHAFVLSVQLVGAFVICTAPYMVVYSYYLLVPQDEAKNFNPHFREILLAFSASHSIINPFLYGRKIIWSFICGRKTELKSSQIAFTRSTHDGSIRRQTVEKVVVNNRNNNGNGNRICRHRRDTSCSTYIVHSKPASPSSSAVSPLLPTKDVNMSTSQTQESLLPQQFPLHHRRTSNMLFVNESARSSIAPDNSVIPANPFSTQHSCVQPTNMAKIMISVGTQADLDSDTHS